MYKRARKVRLNVIAAAAAAAVSSMSANAVDVVWTGAEGSFWDIATNWNPSGVPGVADSALLGAFGTVFRQSVVPIQSFTGTGTLTITGGTLRVAQASSIGNLSITGGTLGGSGTVTAGTLNWSGGQMGESSQGFGTTTITGASTIDGTDTNYLYYGRTLNLNGNTSWTQGNGNIYVYSASQGTSTLNIGSGTTFTDAGTVASNNTRYIGYYGDGVVNNAGTYVRNGLGTTSINAGQFNNTGTVTVNSGILDLGPGTSSGTFAVASGAVLQFSSGTYNLTAGSLSNAGTLRSIGGTTNIQAGVTYSGSGAINVSGGVLNSAVGTTLTPGSLVISGGTARFAGAVNTSSLEMTGGTLGGPGTVTAGTLNWSGGQMGESGQGFGTTTITGASTIDGTDTNYLYYGRTLNLNGNTSWTQGNGNIYVYSGNQGTSTLNIASGTTFTDAGTVASNNTRYLGYQTDGVVNNAGTYVRNGLGTTSINVGQFNNTGTVTVNSGTLDLGPGTSSGTFAVASGAVLQFSSGTYNLTGGSLSNAGTLRSSGGTANIQAGVTYSGSGAIAIAGGLLNSAVGTTLTPGSLVISGGTARFAGAVNTSSLELTGGAIGGSGTVTAGTLNWSGGQMGESSQGFGTTTITGASTIDGTDTNYLYYGRTLNLNGNTSWTQGNGNIYVYSGNQGTSTLNIASGTTFTDAGTVASNNTRYIGYYGDGVVNNAGTYVRNGLGTTSINAGQFNNTGTVTVNSGILDLGPGTSSGTFAVASGAVLQFSSGTYNLTAGSLSNAGTLRSISGTTNIQAGVTYSGSGAINVSGGVLNSAVGTTLTPGSLVISGGTARFAGAVNTSSLEMTGGTLGGPGTVTAGTLNWSGGQMGESGQGFGTTTITGASTIDGTDTNYLYYGRTLNLNGNTSWTQGNGNIYVYSGNQGTSTLNIASGTTFTDAGTVASNNTRYLGYQTDGVVNNAGTYVRNGLGTTSINAGQFNNTGTVTVNSGTLDLGPGTSSGTFNVASGALLQFSSGTHNLTGGSLVNNGTVQVSSGTVAVSAPLVASGSGVLQISGGTLRMLTGSSVSPSNLVMTGGAIGGPGTVTAGTLNWSGGTMGESSQGFGTTTITGASTIDGTDTNYLYYGRTLNLNGNTSWTQGNGNIYVYSGNQGTSTLNIASGATFTDAGTVASNNTRYIGYYGDGVVNNAGTYVRNGLGTTSINAGQFNNTGTVTVNSGTLDLGPGTSSGTLNVASGAVLQFSSGTFNLAGGTVANAGTTRLSGGTLYVSAPPSYSGSGLFEITGGSLRAQTTFTVGNFNFSGGAIGVSGQVNGVMTATGTTTFDGTDANYLYYGHTLNLNGNATWTQGNQSIFVYSASQGTSTLNIGSGTTFTDAGTVASNNTRYLGYYGDGAVNNAGTYVRNGVGTTSINSGQFNNTGTVTVNGGTLDMGPGSSSGTFNVASGAVLQFSSGTFNITGGSLVNNGTTQVSGGVVAVSAPLATSGSGTLQITGGTLRMLTGSSMAPSNLAMTGGTLGGPGTITAGTLNWSGGQMGESGQGFGTTTVTGAATIDGTDANYLYYGRTLNLNGNTSWTQGNQSLYVYSASQGTSTLNIGSGTTFTDAGTVASNNTRYLGYYGDGAVNNAGTYVRNGVGTTSINSGQFNNTGTVTVNGGTLDMGPGSSSGTFNVASGAVLQFSSGTFNITGGSLVNNGTTQVLGGVVAVSAPLATSGSGTLQITGGTLRMLTGSSMAPSNLAMTGGTLGGPGTITAGTLNWSGGQMGESGQGFGTTTVTGAATIDGTDANYLYYGRTLNLNGNTSWTQGNQSLYVYSASQGTSTLNIGSGATFNDAGTVASNNTRYFGYYSDGAVNNAGTYNRNGLGTTVAMQINNTGTINVNSGTMQFQSLQGTGTLQIGAGGVATATASNTTVGRLVHNGAAAGSLDLGSRTITVSNDYDNANFGVGNAFNRRANVVTTGAATPRLLAAGDVNQALSGVAVSNGNTTTPSIVIGNVRVGSTTYAYNIENTGSSGPSLRGAIQTSVGGASITDTRLSGNGIEAANWGPVAAGESIARNVTLTIDSAGVFAPISGQAVGIVNNFENTRSQLVTISSQAGAAAYVVAAGTLNTSPLNFGTVQVGQNVAQALSITNSATGTAGFVEDLNARFGASSGTGAAQISGTGSISSLIAGSTNGSAMTVNVDTSTAGTINGTILVNYYSAGTVGGVSKGLAELGVGSSNYAVSGVIESSGQVIDQALPVLNTSNVNFGNVRIGSAAPSQLVSVTNQATGNLQAALNASISATSPVAASGSFALLAPGGTNSTSLQVGMNTTAAGAVNGNATVAFVSDASNVGNCAPNCQLVLASQDVAVSGAVYRLASPSITTGPITLAARVGNVSPSASIGVTNVSPDAYTERLNASIGAGPSGFTTSGAINGLVAGASSTALGVALNTSTAGNYAGQVAVGFVSSGTGTTGAADEALPSQNVNLTGKVYTPAVAQVNTTVLNFGIVHKGDVVAAKNVSVTNAAAVAVPNDTLRGGLAGASGPFNASGTLAGVGAQQTDSSSLSVALNTANAGVFNGNATATFASHNPDMTDLALGSVNVALQAQVNNYAELAVAKTGGSGTLAKSGSTYTIDFGSLLQGATDLDATLAVLNIAAGPADLLSGSFAIGTGSGFSLSGFNSFSDIVAGSSFDGLGITFDSALLGEFTQTIVISAVGSNASGFAEGLADTTLVLRGSVVAVPEPGTYALMFGGLLALWLLRRRQQALSA